MRCPVPDAHPQMVQNPCGSSRGSVLQRLQSMSVSLSGWMFFHPNVIVLPLRRTAVVVLASTTIWQLQ